MRIWYWLFRRKPTVVRTVVVDGLTYEAPPEDWDWRSECVLCGRILGRTTGDLVVSEFMHIALCLPCVANMRENAAIRLRMKAELKL